MKRKFRMRVSVKGAVVVNQATVERDYGDCLLVCIDLRSKRAVLSGVSGGEKAPPCLYLAADDDTLHLDESKPRDALTEVQFPDLKGWNFFCVEGPARYTLKLTLTAPDVA